LEVRGQTTKDETTKWQNQKAKGQRFKVKGERMKGKGVGGWRLEAKG
jgi:hypothetical protein